MSSPTLDDLLDELLDDLETEDGRTAPKTANTMLRRLDDAIFNTQIARTENSFQHHGFEAREAEERYIRLAEEASKVTLGPMPVDAFMNAFLPRADDIGPELKLSSKDAFKDVPKNAAHEKKIYEPLVNPTRLI